ncbi:aminoglycoside phosphotransferase family protein [Compostimonas suwonensis]|nr:aminoglycoside phosphotransferase family protein [Compostimonas suwonensis]
MSEMSDEQIRALVDDELVARLIGSQFPRWAGLPVRPVEHSGWDNRTFRLGDELLVRLPSGRGYVPQVQKEHRWLPALAPRLPLPIPAPLAQGEPGAGYPFIWSVYGWIEGEPASIAPLGDPLVFATELAGFLRALRAIDASDGPAAGAHSAFRGAPLEVYDDETRRALAVLGDRVPADARAVWQAALDSPFAGPPVWFHGDVAAGNLLVRQGRLAAVLDFGCSGVGDPACDTTIAWTMLTGDSREAFRAELALDEATWARGRGWALWKSLITLAGQVDAPADAAERTVAEARRVLAEVLDDHRRAA